MTNRVRSAIEAEFDAKLADNTTQDITAADLRSACTDMNDTIFRENAIALEDLSGRILLEQGGYLLQAFESEAISPPDISGLVLWLDASDRGVTTNTWDDKSGQSNHYVADNAGLFPSFSGGVARFDGARRVEGTATTGMTEGEVFIRWRVDADPAPNINDGGSFYMGQTANNNASAMYPYNDGLIYEAFGRFYAFDAPAHGRILWNPSQDLTTYHTYNAYSKANDWQAFINGVSQATDADSQSGAFNTDSWIGMGFLTTSYLHGDIKSFVVFNRKLTTQERSDMNDYMDAL